MKTNRVVNVGKASLLSQEDPDALTQQNGQFDKHALVALRFALCPNPKHGDDNAVLLQFPKGQLSFKDLYEISVLAAKSPQEAEAKLRQRTGDPEIRLREFALFADDVATRETALVRGTTLGVGGDLLTALRVWGGYGARITIDDADGKTKVVDTREVSLLTTARGNKLDVKPASIQPLNIAPPTVSQEVSAPTKTPLEALRQRVDVVASKVRTRDGDLKHLWWATPIGRGSVAQELSDSGAMELFQQLDRSVVERELAKAMQLSVNDSRVQTVMRRLDKAIVGTMTHQLHTRALNSLEDGARFYETLAGNPKRLAELRTQLSNNSVAHASERTVSRILGVKAQSLAPLEVLRAAAQKSDTELQTALRAAAQELRVDVWELRDAPLDWRAGMAAQFQEALGSKGYTREVLQAAVKDSEWIKSRDEVLSALAATGVVVALGGALVGAEAAVVLRAAATTPMRGLAAGFASSSGSQLSAAAAALVSLGSLTGCTLPWDKKLGEAVLPPPPTQVELNQLLWTKQEPGTHAALKPLRDAIDRVEAKASSGGEGLSVLEREEILTGLRLLLPADSNWGKVFGSLTAEGVSSNTNAYAAALTNALAQVPQDLTDTSIALAAAQLLLEVTSRPGWAQSQGFHMGLFRMATDVQGVLGQQSGALDAVINEGYRQTNNGVAVDDYLAPMHFYTTDASDSQRLMVRQLIILGPTAALPIVDTPISEAAAEIDGVWAIQTPAIQAQLSQLKETLKTGEVALALDGLRNSLPLEFAAMFEGMTVDSLKTGAGTWPDQLTELLATQDPTQIAKALAASYFLLDLNATFNPPEAWDNLQEWAQEVAGRAPQPIIDKGTAIYQSEGEESLDAYLDTLMFYAFDGDTNMRENFKRAMTGE